MIAKAMAVLELFTTSRRQMGVVEISELLGRPRSTVSRWLAVMERVGLLDREGETGPYRLGIRLAALGELARNSTSLQIASGPVLEALTRATKETASANQLLGSDVVNVRVVESPRPVRQAGGVGISLPVHATAAGKVLLAWRPREEVLRILPPRLGRLTPWTIDDVDTFLDALARVREQGYAVAARELAEDLLTVSAPVRDETGVVRGAITVGGPLERLDPVLSDIIERVKEAAATVSRLLGFRPETASHDEHGSGIAVTEGLAGGTPR